MDLVCRPGDSDNAYGGAGVACGPCGPNRACIERQCRINPLSYWAVVAVDETAFDGMPVATQRTDPNVYRNPAVNEAARMASDRAQPPEPCASTEASRRFARSTARPSPASA